MAVHVLIVAFVLSLAAVAAQRAEEPSLDVVLDRLGAYLLDYEAALSVITADEIYKQDEVGLRWVLGGADRELRRPQIIKKRLLESEIAFVRLPASGEWASFRDVRKVDGRTVSEGRARLTELLTRKEPALKQAAAIMTASSKYNLGALRTINMPTVPLEILHPRHRQQFTYTLDGPEKVRGVTTVRVAFVETASPTVIRMPTGEDVKTSGVAWVDPSSGRLWRATVVWAGGLPSNQAQQNASRLLVEFAEDARLKTMVPVEMDEVFYVPRARGEAHATYRNFKRFETGARLIPQP